MRPRASRHGDRSIGPVDSQAAPGVSHIIASFRPGVSRGPGLLPARRRTAVLPVLFETPDPARRQAIQGDSTPWIFETGHDGRKFALRAPDQEKGKNP